ncbi:hypothetical protein [Pleionea sediminis]|uniref:hypothetical protein n=1 Tax=Pleionea sediminis TaxID=2569479 RepID=UPI0011866A08|nr:hypothetical protein [Pleionea sediminis]
MPDGVEYEEYANIHRECLSAIKEYREKHGVSLSETPLEELREPAYKKYEQLTGFKPPKDSFDHFWHHNADKFGEPCKNCGRNLRTNKAKYCAECGETV